VKARDVGFDGRNGEEHAVLVLPSFLTGPGLGYSKGMGYRHTEDRV